MRFTARGHRNVRGTHGKTLEITREAEMTVRGTCIVGVGASFEPRRVALLRGPVEIRLRVGEVEERVRATVTPFMAARETLIVRKSDERRGKTFAFGADKGAAELDPRLVRALADPQARLEVEIRELDAAARRAFGVLYVADRAAAEEGAGELGARLAAVDAVLGAGALPAWMKGLDPPVERWRLGSEADAAAAAGAIESGSRLALLVGSAGLPEGSPGLELVRAAWRLGLPISSPDRGRLGALAAAGVPFPPARWLGLAPRKRAELSAWLAAERAGAALAIEVEPGRLAPLLEVAAELFPGWLALSAQDLGGRRETLARATLGEREKLVAASDPRAGGCTLVLGPGEPLRPQRSRDPEGGDSASGLRGEAESLLQGTRPSSDAQSPFGRTHGAAPGAEGRASIGEDRALLDALLAALLAQGVPVKTASRALAAATGWSGRRAYRYLLDLEAKR